MHHWILISAAFQWLYFWNGVIAGSWLNFLKPSDEALIEKLNGYLPRCNDGAIKLKIRKIFKVNPNLNLGLQNNLSFRLAAQYGCRDLIEEWMFDPQVDPTAAANDALRRAFMNNQWEIVRILVQNHRINPNIDDDALYKSVIRRSDSETLQYLLTNPYFDPGCGNNFGIILACQQANHTRIVDILLADHRVDPGVGDNTALRHSARLRFWTVVRRLIRHPGVNPFIDNYSILTLAMTNHVVSVISEYVRLPNMDLAWNNHNLIRYAASNGFVGLVRQLLGYRLVNPGANLDEPIRYAASNGHWEVVEILLADPRVNPSAFDEYVLRMAVSQNRLRIVEIFLTKDDSVNLAVHNNVLIRESASRGQTDMVRLLLSSPFIDPGVNNDDAILSASAAGHWIIVRMLAEDPRVNPAIQDSIVFQRAVTAGQHDLVRRLLTNPEINPAVDNNFALRTYSRNVDMLPVLLNDPRIDPQFNSHWLVKLVLGMNQPVISLPISQQIRDIVINHPRVDLTFENNLVLLHAIETRNLDLLRALLRTDRINPGANNNEALFRSMRTNRIDVITILLENVRVDASSRDDDALAYAADHGNWPLVDRLLRDDRVNPASRQNNLLKKASNAQQIALVDRLLDDARVLEVAYEGDAESIEILRRNGFIDLNAAAGAGAALGAEAHQPPQDPMANIHQSDFIEEANLPAILQDLFNQYRQLMGNTEDDDSEPSQPSTSGGGTSSNAETRSSISDPSARRFLEYANTICPQSSQDEEKDFCCICFDTYGDACRPKVICRNRHATCESCAPSLRGKPCPLCRTPVQL